MAPLKILHLASSTGGGAGIAAKRIALATGELQTSILLSRESNIVKANVDRIKNLQKVTESKLVSFLQHPGFVSKGTLVTPLSVSFYRLLEETVKSVQWDVIHVHATYNFVSAEDLERLASSCDKLVMTMHDERIFSGGCHYTMGCNGFKTLCKGCPQVRKPFRGLVLSDHEVRIQSFKRLSRSNVCVTTPSAWLRDSAQSSSALKNIPITLIRNCVPKLFRLERPARIPSRQSRDSVISFGFISKEIHNPYKGFKVLEKAIQGLTKEKRERIKLRILGQGLVAKSICDFEQYVSNSDEETYKFLQLIDVLIVPSIQDNLPNVMLEALVSGKVVIGSNVGGVGEILNLFRMPTFAPGDFLTLAKIMQKLDLGAFNKEEIHQTAWKMFSPETIADQLFNLYLGVSTPS